MSEVPTTLIASVRQRLLNGARERGEEFQLTLTRYAIERLLYRLSRSPHCANFILKGAALFAVWSQENAGVIYRTTRDVDFLGVGDSSVQAMIEAFRDIVSVSVEPDGLRFDANSVTAELVREDEIYEGCHLHLMAHLGAARIPLQIDVGFGDAVTPAAEEGDYPTLLAFPAPRLRLYPRETVVAEKFEAMVALGMANSRMKDFFDVWLLAGQFSFEGSTLCRALSATFARRDTALPVDVPLALTARFAHDAAKVASWKAFAQRNALTVPELDEVTAQLQTFLLLPAHAAAAGSTLDAQWRPDGGWLLPHKTKNSISNSQ